MFTDEWFKKKMLAATKREKHKTQLSELFNFVDENVKKGNECERKNPELIMLEQQTAKSPANLLKHEIFLLFFLLICQARLIIVMQFEVFYY